MIGRKRTVLGGAVFLVVAVVYGLLSRDYGGTTMLAALGIAIGLMAYVLLTGSPRGDEGVDGDETG